MRLNLTRLFVLLFTLLPSACQAPSESPLDEVEQPIGYGVTVVDKAVVGVLVNGEKIGNGTGSFAFKKRCVITAEHNFDVADLKYFAVFATTAKGDSIYGDDSYFDLVHPAAENIVRLSAGHDGKKPEMFNMNKFPDIGLMWTRGHQGKLDKRKGIHSKEGLDYTPYQLDYAKVLDYGVLNDKDDGDKVIVHGYGKDCKKDLESGILREGKFWSYAIVNKTTKDVDKVQTKDRQSGWMGWGEKVDGDKRYRICDGDSGSPELFDAKIVGVISGDIVGGPDAASTLVRPYQPWLELYGEKWCEDGHKVSVRPDNYWPGTDYAIVGIANTEVMSGAQIITCEPEVNDCTQGCGANDETACVVSEDKRSVGTDESDWLTGEGTVTLTANSVPDHCFVGWHAGASCPCVGWSPGQPFTSSSCVLNLRDRLNPDVIANEDKWLNCAFRYEPLTFTSTPAVIFNPLCATPPEPACGDGICSAGESCTSGEYECGAIDCGPCEGYCGDRFCSGNETSGCVDCTCGDDVCQSHESCSTCAYDCGDCLQCGDGICDPELENWCCEDCPSACSVPTSTTSTTSTTTITGT